MTSIDRLSQQLHFLAEIDKLKKVVRRNNLIADTNRLENSAEHSWHLAIYAMILAEYSNAQINLPRVIKMVLVHDLVEIDAGDTFCYDLIAHADKDIREKRAAERLFGLLPPEQGGELRALWEEFEARESADAKFANTVDRLQPFLHNFLTGGGSWKRHDVKRSQVEKRMQPVEEGSAFLMETVNSMLNEAVQVQLLRE